MNLVDHGWPAIYGPRGCRYHQTGLGVRIAAIADPTETYQAIEE
jgi:hypothetical protein